MFSPERISRFLSFLLRHQPKEYPLSFDRQGFASWREVVETLQDRFQEALAVGKRRDPAPAVIVVDAQLAHAEGIRFFAAGPLFLVESVPPKFLSLR